MLRNHTKKLYTFLAVLVVVVFAVALVLVSRLGSSSKSVSKTGFYFDTVITITLYGTDDDAPITDCFTQAAYYENLLSAQAEGSDIDRINEADGAYVTVDEETVALIKRGIYYGDLSDGKFDITIGTLTNLWNLSELAETLNTDNNEADASVLPTEEEVAEALSHVDYHGIEIDGDRVRLTDPEAQIDLGGIAKGYIADRMKETLVAEGVTSAIINLGGDIMTVGAKPDGSDFTIGIQKPFDDEGEVIDTVRLSDRSVVTSGIYERYITVDGQIYHHILDTATGYPYDNGLYSVTILSDSSVDGDALATICIALGVEDGLALIESLDGVEAIFVTSDYEIIRSSGV